MVLQDTHPNTLTEGFQILDGEGNQSLTRLAVAGGSFLATSEGKGVWRFGVGLPEHYCRTDPTYPTKFYRSPSVRILHRCETEQEMARISRNNHSGKTHKDCELAKKFSVCSGRQVEKLRYTWTDLLSVSGMAPVDDVTACVAFLIADALPLAAGTSINEG